MRADGNRWRRSWVAGVVVSVLWVSAACALGDQPRFAAVGPRIDVTASALGGFAPSSHRLATRIEHSFDRFLYVLGDVGVFWLWTAASVAVFLVIAALASVIDVRMMRLGRQQPKAASRYLGYGVRTFFGVLFDRHTPNLARFFILLALVYWLVPSDLIADQSVFPGFIDDIVVTVAAAKGFIYLCPAGLIGAHAAAVEWRASLRHP